MQSHWGHHSADLTPLRGEPFFDCGGYGCDGSATPHLDCGGKPCVQTGVARATSLSVSLASITFSTSTASAASTIFAASTTFAASAIVTASTASIIGVGRVMALGGSLHSPLVLADMQRVGQGVLPVGGFLPRE